VVLVLVLDPVLPSLALDRAPLSLAQALEQHVQVLDLERDLLALDPVEDGQAKRLPLGLSKGSMETRNLPKKHRMEGISPGMVLRATPAVVRLSGR
jgi:hypothetical protein